MSQDQSSTAPSAGVDDSNPSSMNDMFALLLGKINNFKASMATLHEGRSETGEAERVEGEGEGVVEGESNGDDNWLTEDCAKKYVLMMKRTGFR